MPIVVSRDEVAKRGGTYLPPRAAPVRPPPIEIKPPVLPPPPSSPPAQPDAVSIARLAAIMSVGQERTTDKLSQVVDLLGRHGGSWDVEVTERDELGRISRLSFTKTT